MTRDPQNPSYYSSRDEQNLDLTPLVAKLPTFLGTTLKYLCRAGRKPGVPASEDLLKAAHCAKLAVEHSPFETWAAARKACDVLRNAEIWCHPSHGAQLLWEELLKTRIYPAEIRGAKWAANVLDGQAMLIALQEPEDQCR
jgi:hypothetical protein